MHPITRAARCGRTDPHGTHVVDLANGKRRFCVGNRGPFIVAQTAKRTAP